MFCSNCGKEIDDKAVICVHCGCAIQNNVQQKPHKSMALALVLWFFLGVFGAHRFYLGDDVSGSVILFLWILGWLTVWFVVGAIPLVAVCIWWFTDLFLLLCGRIKPADGSELV